MQYILLGFGLGALVACGPSTPLSNVELSRPLRVSAAISLSGPLQILTEDFQRQTGLPVELNLAGSSTLAAQIIAGALVDLYISADTLQMALVASWILGCLILNQLPENSPEQSNYWRLARKTTGQLVLCELIAVPKLPLKPSANRRQYKLSAKAVEPGVWPNR